MPAKDVKTCLIWEQGKKKKKKETGRKMDEKVRIRAALDKNQHESVLRKYGFCLNLQQ